MRNLLALVVVSLAVLLSACKGTAEINLASVGETMTYDQTAFTVKAGQKVHVVLTNHATSQVMKHNWVLVNPGKEAEVATAGMTAGESKNYVQPGDGNVEVTFTAPPAGTYPFICTYPGHYQTMHGTLTVTP
jgi:azurin